FHCSWHSGNCETSMPDGRHLLIWSVASSLDGPLQSLRHGRRVDLDPVAGTDDGLALNQRVGNRLPALRRDTLKWNESRFLRLQLSADESGSGLVRVRQEASLENHHLIQGPVCAGHTEEEIPGRSPTRRGGPRRARW